MKVFINKEIDSFIRQNIGRIIQVEEYLNALSNKVYKVSCINKTVIVKVFNINTSALFNRLQEEKIINYLHARGITPPILYRQKKFMILKYIEGSAVKEFTEKNILELSKNITVLHNSNLKINERNFFKSSLTYVKNYLKDDFIKETIQLGQRIQKKLEIFEKSFAPCHNDININNLIIDEAQKLWLIDFEYASINDIYVDFVCLKNILKEGEFNIFKDTYGESNNVLFNEDKLFYYRLMLDYVTIMWCYRYGYKSMAEDIYIKLNKEDI